MSLDQIFKDRLLLLCDKLDMLPPSRFDFNKWVGNDWKGMPDLQCGTSACGMGWACTIPEFQALGLRMHASKDYNYVYGFPTVTPIDKIGRLSSNEEAMHAAYVIFGLNKNEFEFLFMPWEHSFHEYNSLEEEFGFSPLDEDATAQDLSAHIRRFVEEN